MVEWQDRGCGLPHGCALVAIAALLRCVGCIGAGLVGRRRRTAYRSPRSRPACRTTAIPRGIRKWLAERGVVYGLEYTNDVLSNVRGGLRTGTIDQGKLHGILTVDLDKLFGLQGLSFFANVFQIHNTGRIRRDYVGGINTIAAIEAVPATRLSELWLEQKFADGKVALRAGQLAADAEFFYSETSQLFLQSDWATIAALNLPSGGAAYPLSTPGARLKVDPIKDVSLLLAVLNGDPAGPGPGRRAAPQPLRAQFPRPGSAVRHRRGAVSSATRARTTLGLPPTLKLGGWGHVGQFNDQRLANDGTLLADPSGLGHRRCGIAAIPASTR